MEVGCSNVSSKRMHTPSSVIKEVEFEHQPSHSSKGASFIALLGPDFSKQLQIPHEFTKIFIGYVPHRFIIECAITKKCWRVGVGEEGDGSVYFREGWTDFVEAHSLELGNILLFEYDEQSIFQVKIYDKNGCQKMGADVRGDKHNPVKIFDFEEQKESEALECEPKKLGTRRPCRKKVKRLFTKKNGRGKYKKKHAVPRNYTRSVKVSFEDNKIGFSVKIHKYKTHQFSQLTIPKVISLSKNLASKDEVMLQDATGNRWPVKISHRQDGRAILMHGWKAFLKDNEVVAGDTLNFEVVSDGLIQVGVVKVSQDARKSNEATSQNGEAIASIMDCEAMDDHTANVNPAEDSVIAKRGRKRGLSELSSSSFTFLWRPNTTGSYLHIPKVIIEGQSLMNKDNVVLRDPNGKCWPLEVSTRRDGRVALTKGWVEFWKGHDIKVGDSLHFDFVSEHFIQVNIDKGKPLNSPLNTGQHEGQHEPVVPLSLTDEDELGYLA